MGARNAERDPFLGAALCRHPEPERRERGGRIRRGAPARIPPASPARRAVRVQPRPPAPVSPYGRKPWGAGAEWVMAGGGAAGRGVFFAGVPALPPPPG